MGHNTKDVVAAAGVRPSLRDDDQKAAIKSDSNRQAVRNANHAAIREEKIYGTKDHK